MINYFREVISQAKLTATNLKSFAAMENHDGFFGINIKVPHFRLTEQDVFSVFLLQLGYDAPRVRAAWQQIAAELQVTETEQIIPVLLAMYFGELRESSLDHLRGHHLDKAPLYLGVRRYVNTAGEPGWDARKRYKHWLGLRNRNKKSFDKAEIAGKSDGWVHLERTERLQTQGDKLYLQAYSLEVSLNTKREKDEWHNDHYQSYPTDWHDFVSQIREMEDVTDEAETKFQQLVSAQSLLQAWMPTRQSCLQYVTNYVQSALDNPSPSPA